MRLYMSLAKLEPSAYQSSAIPECGARAREGQGAHDSSFLAHSFHGHALIRVLKSEPEEGQEQHKGRQFAMSMKVGLLVLFVHQLSVSRETTC